ADAGPHEGLLEAGQVAPVKRWLTMLAGPDRARSVIARTLRGSLAMLRPWVDALAEAVQAQADAAHAVRSELAAVVEAPAASARGRVVEGEVAAGTAHSRWAQLTATGAPLADVVSRRGRVRGGARAGKVRARALESLVADLSAAARVSFYTAGELVAEALEVHLEARGAVGRSVVQMWRSSAGEGPDPVELRRGARAPARSRGAGGRVPCRPGSPRPTGSRAAGTRCVRRRTPSSTARSNAVGGARRPRSVTVASRRSSSRPGLVWRPRGSSRARSPARRSTRPSARCAPSSSSARTRSRTVSSMPSSACLRPRTSPRTPLRPCGCALRCSRRRRERTPAAPRGRAERATGDRRARAPGERDRARSRDRG